MSYEIKEIMTFRTGDSLFGVPIQNVLSIMGETDNLSCKSFRSKEGLGIIEYRGTPVSVIDLAIAGDIVSDTESKKLLIETLKEREQDHINWLNALEVSLETDAAFTLARDPHKCKFGMWYDTFETKDEDLREILKDFDEPHKKIHALADTLCDLKAAGETEQSIEILKLERVTTLPKLRLLFNRAITQLQSTIKPVFIYLTLDGATPCAAIRVDEIADVESVEENSFVSMNDMALPQVNDIDYMTGFIKLGDKGDCLLIDVNILTKHRSIAQDQAKTA